MKIPKFSRTSYNSETTTQCSISGFDRTRIKQATSSSLSSSGAMITLRASKKLEAYITITSYSPSN